MTARPMTNVLLPVETMSRELDCRLFVAGLFAAPHRRIFVGQHDELFRLTSRVQGGLYVGKHFNRQLPEFTDLSRYRVLKQRGFTVLHLDEEGAVYDGDEERWRWWLLKMQFDPRGLEPEDYVCTWGDFQRDFYRSLKPRCGDHIVTTGHPRFDLYKPAYRAYYQPEIDRLRGRFGDFILVNTNLGYANHCLGPADLFSPRVGYHVDDPAQRLEFVRRYTHDLKLLSHFVRLIHRLGAELPKTQIVLRPHPSEDVGYYQSVFRGVSNVRVVREGNVAPWLFACRLLIHDGCTTGLEAYLAGTPVINYKSEPDPAYALFLTDLFGMRCHAEDEVVRHARLVLSAGRNGAPDAQLNETAHALMANFRHDTFRRLLDTMAQAEAERGSRGSSCDVPGLRRAEAAHAAVRRAKNLVRPLFPAKQRFYRTMRTFFPGLDSGALEQKFALIRQVTGRPVRHTVLSDMVAVVESDE